MANASEIREISLEGFKVVSGEMFNHLPRKSEPTCTMWSNSLSFSKMAISTLNNCERIRIEVNAQQKRLLAIPVTAKDRDNVRWVKNMKELTSRKLECRGFTAPLFEAWKWDEAYVYRAVGKLVTANQKVMLLFDFNDAENWKAKPKDKVDA